MEVRQDVWYEFDPSELVCGGCSDVAQAQDLKVHLWSLVVPAFLRICVKCGTDFLEHKCRCCSMFYHCPFLFWCNTFL